MNRRVVHGLALLLAFTPAMVKASTNKVLALTRVGPVSEAWVSHLAGWAETSLAVRVVILPGSADAVDTLDEAAGRAREMMAKNHAAVVVLVDPAKKQAAHGVRKPGEPVAVVNVQAMKSDGAGENVQLMRLERQVIRAMAMLLDLESSPNPQSAMFAYGSMQELDEIGRNLDPPWLLRFQQSARSRGIELDSANPFYLLD